MGRGFYVCAGITAAMWAAAYALLPFTGMANLPIYTPLPLWLSMMGLVLACHIFAKTVRLMLAGRERPIATMWSEVDWGQAKKLGAWTVLMAVNLSAFCMIKPQLGQIVPFSADPLLARADYLLFFGHDAWRVFGWFNHPYLSNIYHRAWFLWLAFVLFWLTTRPESEEKSRLMIGYCLMWGVFGPLVHLMLPAAGPVFYQALGYGDRFADLHQGARTDAVARYLWTGYVDKTFNPAGGISAMPSLHLATMFWSLIAIRRTKWIWFGWAFTTYIFIGSIVIGWHYAIDGIAGGIGALLCYWIAGVRFGDIAAAFRRVPRLAGTPAAAECQSEAI
jgi:hypothetical protein